VTAERILDEEAGELAGKRIVYTLRIKSLRSKRLPEADDEFARSVGVEEGLEELRTRLAQRIMVEKVHERRRVWREALIAHLRGEKEIELPDRVVQQRTRHDIIEFARGLAARGVDPEKAELDWARIEVEMRRRVEEQLRGELVLDALADRLGLVVGDADVDAEIEKESRRTGVPFAELKGNLGKRGDFEEVRSVLRRERAVDEVLARFPAERSE
jgi:trigger factor